MHYFCEYFLSKIKYYYWGENMSKNDKKKNIEYKLDIERKDAQNPNMEKYDFIFPFNHITSIDEQKIKVEELENITKIKKDNKKTST